METFFFSKNAEGGLNKRKIEMGWMKSDGLRELGVYRVQSEPRRKLTMARDEGEGRGRGLLP